MWISRRTVGLVAFAMVAVSACASSGVSSPSPAVSQEPSASAAPIGLVGPTWVVSTIGGNDTVADSRPTMTFGADGQVQGTGGCNSYGGPYKLDGAAIDIGDLASTMMMCTDQSIGAQETAFFTALGGAQTWQIQAGDLVLAGAAQIVAKSAAAEPSGSAATGLVGAWNLAEMGPTADFAHLQPTIAFTADGGVSGFAGCNTFSGSYTTDGSTLTWGPLATTEMGCQRPGSAVESDYLAALSGVNAWTIESDGRLLLDGAVPLRYTPR